MLTIVYANPVKEGMNAIIHKELEMHLGESNNKYYLIDLYEDNFSPLLTMEERRTFFTGSGISEDPIVKKYQDILKETDHVVFVFPIWWMTIPAILKGFFERTFLPNYSSLNMKPMLNNIKRFTVLTTAAGLPKQALTDTIEKHFIKGMLYRVTEKSECTWLHLTGEMASEPDGMKNHIKKMKQLL